jgi:hypothetical protein
VIWGTTGELARQARTRAVRSCEMISDLHAIRSADLSEVVAESPAFARCDERVTTSTTEHGHGPSRKFAHERNGLRRDHLVCFTRTNSKSGSGFVVMSEHPIANTVSNASPRVHPADFISAYLCSKVRQFNAPMSSTLVRVFLWSVK